MQHSYVGGVWGQQLVKSVGLHFLTLPIELTDLLLEIWGWIRIKF